MKKKDVSMHSTRNGRMNASKKMRAKKISDYNAKQLGGKIKKK